MPIHALHFFGGDVQTWTLVGRIPFLIFIIALYWGGRRQGWPWRAALVVTAAFVVGLGVGTALLPSVLGAVGGGIATWFLAQKVLGLRCPPLTVLALGLTALIAVGRWGCFLNGCCFGTLTDLPWSVRYAAGSSPFFLHQALGLLGDGARQSLPVHPYPAYESLGLALWLPFALWLGRRLRSKGALLAFCAAFDLGLRAWIEGTRAMINVWWSLLGFWQGLNTFQWALLASALVLLLLGILFEYRARISNRTVEIAAAAMPSSSRLWLVYLGLWTIGWTSDASQTEFVHHALLVALAACVPALALPPGLAMRVRARISSGYAVAAALALVLAIHLESGARAVVPEESVGSPMHRTWLYDVDQRRGVVVRVGNDRDDDRVLRLREDTIGLPSLAVSAKRIVVAQSSGSLLGQMQRPPTWFPQVEGEPPVEDDPPLPESASRPHLWVAGGLYRGEYSHTETVRTENTRSSGESDGSCSGSTYTTTTHERVASGGWLQVEGEIPYKSQGVFWIGGRVGRGAESQHTDGALTGDYLNYNLNLWGEYEQPEVAFGLGAVGGYGRDGKLTLYPGFHLRAGSRFGFEAGFADRMSFFSQQDGRAGFTFAIRRGSRIRHPDDARLRCFVGALFFPGADIQTLNIAPGFGIEVFVTPRVVLGVGGGLFTDQAFGGIHLRTAVAP